MELEPLSRALSKLSDIRPAKHELRQLDAIRAVASACERQIESFLGKIWEFDRNFEVCDAQDNRYKCSAVVCSVPGFEGWCQKVEEYVGQPCSDHQYTSGIPNFVSTVSTY